RVTRTRPSFIQRR
ncbi:molybdate ABC transporter, periplasmic molybdate-binding protein, partial [Vibrio parahaemolyticus VPTS-2010]